MANDNSERVRLLFVANTESVPESVRSKGRGDTMSEASASIMKKWPHHVFFTVWIYIALAAFIIIIVLVTFGIVTVKFGKSADNKRFSNTTVSGSVFCKPITDENFTLLALGYVEAKTQFHNDVDTRNKMYYVIDRPISDQDACAIESALRLFHEKTFYVIEMEESNCTDNSSRTDYLLLLRKHFTNLNKMKAQILTVFEGTPFEGSFDECNALAIYATKVLLVWQYGGTSLSTNVVFTSRRIFDSNEGMCEVDRELLFCPGQCSAYVYQLIREVLDTQKNNQTLNNDKKFFFQKIVDDSIYDFCGQTKLDSLGCAGVNRVKNESICNFIKRGCDFMRMDEWKRKNVDWKQEITRVCPIIFKHVYKEEVNKKVSFL